MGQYSQVFVSSNEYSSKALYRKRRLALMKKLDSLCVIAGIPKDPGSEESYTETWNRFVQDPAFLFLTGVNQAGCYLLIDPKTSKEILFVPNKDAYKEFWFGKKLGFYEGVCDVKKVTGIDDVRSSDEFYDVLKMFAGAQAKRAKGKNFIYAFFYENFKDDHNDQFRKQLKKHLVDFEIKSMASIHFELRLPLEKQRVADAKQAQKITEIAFRRTLSNFSTFKNERDLGLFLNYEMQKLSDGDLAFPTIVASGKNACCLHYVKNDEPLRKGDLVLLDFGIRYGTLHSDISRTLPIGGKFDPLQKMLYQIVLDAQAEYSRHVRPGVTLSEIGMIPWDFIIEALEERLVRGAKGKYHLLYEKRPHGVSHFIGEQIHEGDPGNRSLDVVLKPGMLISCEPGLYGTFEANINGKKYKEKIGIRIEDDLLITEKSYKNLSNLIPKSIEDIESLIHKANILN
ncbi:MAG: aminopeptidase P family protein [Fibrobacter sp.]|nr:aminopeptidase P family protein [Fibrobacter sp.]